MASNHSIDRLFRERTGNIEMRPSADAWHHIEAAIQTKKPKNFIWRVAAVITILLTSGVLTWTSMPKVDQESIAQMISIDAPVVAHTNALVIPERSIMNQTYDKVEPQKTQSIPPVDLITPKDIQVSDQMLAKEMIPYLKLEKKSEIQSLNSDLIPIAPYRLFEPIHEEKINIIYYAYATPDEIDASKGKLAKIIDYARTTTPIDWVGDIRQKKDEWIENVLSLD